MNKSLVSALASLIPTHSSSLPPELLDLAASLLAQSNSKASSLKPEEEIGRTYVCAHIACERLKQFLNLPKIAPRPPCPPKVYKKLYAYLDSAIPAKAARSPSKRARRDNGTSNPPTPTVKRTRQAAPLDTPMKQKPSNDGKNQIYNADGVSSDIMPAVREVCKVFGAPGAIPHVYAGFCSVVKLQQSKVASPAADRNRPMRASRQTTTAFAAESQYPALLIVILLCAYSRLSGEETTPDKYLRQRDKAIDILLEQKISKEVTREKMTEDVQLLMREAQNGWLELEWYTNIEEASGLSGESTFLDGFSYAADRNPDDQGHGTTEKGEIGREHSVEGFDDAGLARRNTSTQIDYFSEERKQECEKWKAKILSQIMQIEGIQEDRRRGAMQNRSMMRNRSVVVM